MSKIHQETIQCPYCWQTIPLGVDGSILHQEYIEDCSVCCRPLQLNIQIVEQDIISIGVEGIE